MKLSREERFRKGWSVGFSGAMGKEEGRLQLVFCCRTRDKTEGIVLGKQR